jgi:DNA helicase-2/ATP-dependent DNA helicase PcrA
VGVEEPHDPRSEKVAVMTLHASKGREFEVVFLAGVEPGLMPLELDGFRTDLEEERRLLYVGVTRAKQLAIISYAAKRTLFGKQLPGGPSPWLDEIPGSAITRIKPHWGKKRSKQLSLF